MSNILKKGLKPFLIKYVALFMGVCYLTNPMHQQISGLFHEISHVLESPAAILSHSHQGDHDFNNHDKHGNGDHTDSEHRLAATDHQHDLLDLIATIFDASEGQNTEDETVLILIKCDKHISSQQVILHKTVPLITSHNSYSVAQKVKKGFLNLPEEPPQMVSV